METTQAGETTLNKIVAVSPIVKKIELLATADPENPGEITVDLQGRLLKTYFELESKIGSHIETYNNWVQHILPYQVASTKLNVPEGEVTILNLRVIEPRIVTGTTYEIMTPRMARDNGYTYAFELFGDLVLNKDTPNQKTNTNVFLGKIPAMLGSMVCHLRGKSPKELNAMGECGWDPFGYFIIKGAEKVVLIQERLRTNRVLLFNSSSKGDAVCKMACRTSGHGQTRFSNVTLILRKDRSIDIHLPFMGRTPVPTEDTGERDLGEAGAWFEDVITPVNKKVGNTISVFQVFRMLGITSPAYIMQFIYLFAKKQHHSKIYAALQNSFQSMSQIGDDIEYISRRLKNMKDLDYGIKRSSIMNDLITELFPQIPANNIRQKLFMLAIMVVRFAEYMIGVRGLDDRDNWGNKQLLTAGRSMEDLFNSIWREVTNKANDSKPANLGALARNIHANIVTDTFVSSFTANNWGVKASRMKQNITEQLERKSTVAVYSHLTRISTPGTKNASAKVRMVDMSQLGYICPVETPEGGKCGLNKNTALTCYISVDHGEARILQAIQQASTQGFIGQAPSEKLLTVLILNGKFLGWCAGSTLHSYYISLRRGGFIEKDTTIVYNRGDDYLYIYTDGGRPTRPLLILNNGELVIKTKNLWNADMATLLKEGCVEYIDAFEQEYIQLAETLDSIDMRLSELEAAQLNNQEAIERLNELERIRDDPELAFKHDNIEDDINATREALDQAAMILKDLQEMPPYTHSEVDPTAILSLNASLIPLANHNQAPRNVYQCKMGGQSMGIYHSQNATRFDTTSKVLAYPTRPLFETQMNQVLGLNELPAGSMVIIAITTYTGYNQEDSIIMNKASIDRGLFRQVLYKSFKDHIHRKSPEWVEKFQKPPNKRGKDDHDRFHAIDENGIAILGAFVREKDAIIGKTRTNTENGRVEDASTYVGVGMEGVVDRVLVSTNTEGKRVVKVKLRQVRKPVMGDKFASRYAQKATLGMILNPEDMPFTVRDGVIPDIIINPHTIPSRMTIAKLLEIVSSKVAVFKGERVNATAFRKFDIDSFKRNLKEYGFAAGGKERLQSGFTGRLMEAQIYTGPCYYQALQHNVADKIQMRAQEGPITKLARQPIGGRANRGGQRVGEMERDAIISHGATAFLQERLCTVSDAYKSPYCEKCGTIAITEIQTNKFVCNTCGDKAKFGSCTIPHSFKLLSHMLAGAGFNLTMQMGKAMHPDQPVITKEVVPEGLPLTEEIDREIMGVVPTLAPLNVQPIVTALPPLTLPVAPIVQPVIAITPPVITPTIQPTIKPGFTLAGLLALPPLTALPK